VRVATREDVGEVSVMRTGLDFAGSERVKDRRQDVETETHGYQGKDGDWVKLVVFGMFTTLLLIRSWD